MRFIIVIIILPVMLFANSVNAKLLLPWSAVGVLLGASVVVSTASIFALAKYRTCSKPVCRVGENLACCGAIVSNTGALSRRCDLYSISNFTEKCPRESQCADKTWYCYLGDNQLNETWQNETWHSVYPANSDTQYDIPGGAGSYAMAILGVIVGIPAFIFALTAGLERC